MANKPDRRPERTRTALRSAFIDLILERGYEHVTVADVVERANVGRSTLYAHFGGLDGMLRQSLTNPSTQLADIIDRPFTAEALAPLLRHFWDQRRRNAAFFTPPIRGLWVRRLAELIEPRLAALAKSQGRPVPVLPWGFVSSQVAEAQIALIASWLTQRQGTAPDVIAAALISLTRSTVDALVPHN
jgi:AcrR family transcriptional regulator